MTSVQDIEKYIRRVIDPFADKVDDASIRIIESANDICNNNERSFDTFISELESTFTEETIIVMVLIYHIYDWWPWLSLKKISTNRQL